jgi:hypothetical protein
VSPSLAEIQLALAERILGGDAPDLDAWIAVPPGVDAAERLSAYTNGYPARIRESLREAYPALLHILGDRSFAELAERYLPHVPAGEPNLNFVGSALPGFVAHDSLARDLPFLPDLARLEWAVNDCFHARLADPFDALACEDWKPEAWSSACIDFQPGTALVRSPWPVRALRECRNVAREEIDVDLVDRPENVLVHRADLDVVTRVVDDTEAEALDLLLAGEPLGRVVADLAARGANADAVSSHFAAWARSGLIAHCRVRSRPLLPGGTAVD